MLGKSLYNQESTSGPFSFGFTRPNDASQQGGGPKRSLDLGIPAEKKTLYRQEGTTEPELTNFYLQTLKAFLGPCKALKASF